MTTLTAKYKSYPSYKPAGVEWLGEIPEHWEVRRIKRVADLNPSKAEAHAYLSTDTPVTFLPMERVGAEGQVDVREKVATSRVWNGFTYFRRNDVIVAKITPCFENGKGALLDSLPTEIGFGSTEFHVLRAKLSVNPQFLFRLTTETTFRQNGTEAMTGAAGQKRVPAGFVANYKVPLPPLAEQRAIAAFLDRETGKIDALIFKNERLVELLQEKRTALISRAVTKGLDANAPMKESGVEWLGEIPAHWEVQRLRYLASIKTGDRDTVDRQDDGKYPFFVRSQTVETIDSWSFDGEAVLTAGDGVGVGKVFHYVNGKFDYHQRVYRFSDFRSVTGKYFFRYFKAMLRFEVLQGTAKSTVDSLRLPMLKDFPVLVPPPAEQGAVTAFLDRETAKLDSLIAKVHQAIELLKELRSALISAAVTGRIDVREETECT